MERLLAVQGFPRRWVVLLTAISMLCVLVAHTGAGATVVPPASVPSAPTHVSAAPGNASATVYWTKPSASNGSAITGYVLSVLVGGVEQRQVAVRVTTAWRIAGLTNGKKYAFRVSAQNAHGLSAAGTSAGVTVGTPIAPTSATATRGVARATIAWHAPTTSNGSPITAYVVTPYYLGVPQAARTYASKSLTATVTGLAVGHIYTFRVAAKNRFGSGLQSLPSSAITPTSALGPNAPPPPNGYFPTLPAGATLPTGASCAAQVHYSNWEPRPQNNAANHRAPTLPLHVRNHPDFNGTWQSQFRPRINGLFTGTTDEIIQWASCKWGISDEVIRAQAVDESNWQMNTESDFENRSRGHCTKGDTRDRCPTSFGILQIKWYYNPDSNPVNNSYPMSKTMTAFSLDYTLAGLRGCYEGWEYFGSKSRNDLWGCLGAWYSGSWRDAGALSYIDRVQNFYDTKPWRHW